MSHSNDEESSDSESGDEFDANKKDTFNDKHLQRSRKRIMDSSSDWSEDNVGSQRKQKSVKKPKIFDTDSSDEDTALSKQTPAKKSALKKPTPSLKSNQSSCEGKLTTDTITDKLSRAFLTTSATLKKKSDARPSKHVRLQKPKPILPLTSDSSSSSSSSDESDASHEVIETKETTLSAIAKGKPRPSSQSTPRDRTGSKTKRRESESNRPAAVRKPRKDSLSLFNFVSDESDSDGDIARLEKKSPSAARKVPKVLSYLMDSGSSSDDYLFTDPPTSDLTNKYRDGEKKVVTTVREKKEDTAHKRSHSASKPDTKFYDKSKKAHNKSDLPSENASRSSDVVKASSAPKQGKSMTSFPVKHDGDGKVSSENNPPRKTPKKELVEFNDDSNSQGTCDTDMLKAPSGDNKTELKGRISKHVKNKEKSGKKREKFQHSKDVKSRHSADTVATKMEGGKKDKVPSLKVPNTDDADRRDESIKADAAEKRSDGAKHPSRETWEKNYNAIEKLDGAYEKKFDDAFMKTFVGAPEKNFDSVSGKKIGGAFEKFHGASWVKVGVASEKKIGGAPEKKIGGASENKIGGASEKLHDAPEKKIGGASEKLHGASEKKIGGAPEKKIGGAPEKKIGGAPENKIGGASEKLHGAPEKKIGGASEKLHGASWAKVGGAPEKKIGGEPENKIGGASEKLHGAPEKKIGGAFEKFHGASEVKIGGASEKKIGSASEKTIGGAFEKFHGASEVKIGGASEKKIGSASEKKIGGAFEKFHGASEVKIGGASEKKIGSASEKKVDGVSEKKFDGASQKKSEGEPGIAGNKIESASEKKIDGSFEKSFDSASEKMDDASQKKNDGASDKNSDGAFEKVDVASGKKSDGARKLTSLDVPQKSIDGASEKKAIDGASEKKACSSERNVGAKHFTSHDECADKTVTEAKPLKQKGHKLTTHDDVKKTDKVKRSSEAESVVVDVKTEVTEKKSKSKKNRIASHGGSSERQTVDTEKGVLQPDNIFEKLQYSCLAETPPDTQTSLTPDKDKNTSSVEMSLEEPAQSETSVAVEAIPAPVAKSPGEKLQRLFPSAPLTTVLGEVSRRSEEVAEEEKTSVVVGSDGQFADEHSVPAAAVKTESTVVRDVENTRAEPEKPSRKVEEKPPGKDQSLLDSIAVASCMNQPFMTGHSEDGNKTETCASPTGANAQPESSTCNQTKEGSDSDNDQVGTSEPGIPDLETEAAVLGILPTSDTEYGYWSGADNFDISSSVSAGYGGRDVKKVTVQSSLYETPEHELTTRDDTPEAEHDGSLFISEDIATSSETVKPEKESVQQSYLSCESALEQSHFEQENVSKLENIVEQSHLEQDSVSNFEQDKVSEASENEDTHERPRSHQQDASPLKKETAFEHSQLRRESSPEQPDQQQETTHGQSETKQDNVCEPTSPTKAKFDQSRLLQDFVSEQFRSQFETKPEQSWLKPDDAHEKPGVKQEIIPEAPRAPQETAPVVMATASDLTDSVLHDVSDDNDLNQDSLVVAEQSFKPRSRQVVLKLRKKRLQRKGNAVVEEIHPVETEPVSQRPEERLSKLFSSKRTAATVDTEVAWGGIGDETGDATDSVGFSKDRLEMKTPDKDATVIRASEHPSLGDGMATCEDLSEPTLTKSAECELPSPQAADKFSSRGRKIITKDRDDEVTGPQKKGRGRKAVGSSDGGELEITPKPRRGRKTSGRFSADDEAELKPAELPEPCTEDSEEQATSSVEVTAKYRRSPRGRRSSRRIGAPHDKDDENDQDKEDIVHTDSCTDETPTKGKRVRRPKTRSSAEAAPTLGYTRHRVLENSLSPRRKSLETILTSPKDAAKQATKSEKSIAMDVSLKVEEKHKTKADAFGKLAKVEHDLYDFVEDDEEENALTHISLQTHRKLFSAADAARKSAHEDVSADLSAPGKAGPTAAVKEHAPEHPPQPEPIEPVAGTSQKKPFPIADHVTPAVKLRQECVATPKEETGTTPGHSPDGIYEAKSIAAKYQYASADMHLPLKLEMKHHQHDFDGVKPETHKQMEEIVEQSPCRRSSDGSAISVSDIWSNMDTVINEVARGNFERGDSYDFYSKKPRSCSEDTRPMPGYAAQQLLQPPQQPQRPQQQLKPVCYGPMSQVPVMMAQPPSKAAAMSGLPSTSALDAQHPVIQKHAGNHATTSSLSSKYHATSLFKSVF